MFQTHEYPINAYLEVLRADYRRQGCEVEFLPFYYNAEFVPVNAATTANAVNTCDNDADFAIYQTMHTAVNAAGGAFVSAPNITVRITYDVSGRRLEDRDSHLLNIFGRGQRPFWWPRPLMIRAKGSWTTTVNNLDPAVNFNLRLTYGGVKVYKLPPRG
jgi:hypothetical protein